MKRHMPKRPVVVIGLLFISMGFAVYSGLRLRDARSGYTHETHQLVEAQGYAQKILENRDVPQLVSDREMELTHLARLIERSADQAKVPRQALDRIWPQPPRRIGDTVYQRKATQLVIRDITLPQVIRFLHGLAVGDSPLRIDSLRLSAPRNSSATHSAGRQTNSSPSRETWTLEATVSHLLYKPAADQSSVAQRN